MKIIILIFYLQFFYFNAVGQYWEGVGEFSSGVRSLFSDSIENKIYIGGTFATIDSSTYNGVAVWDNSLIVSMGSGQDSVCNPFNCPPILDFIKYQNKIFCTTPHTPFDGITNGGIMIWDGNAWSSFEKSFYSFSQIAIIRNMEIIDGDLYFLGDFRYIDSAPINSIVKWNGMEMLNLDFPSPLTLEFSDLTSISLFNNELYVAGNFVAKDTNGNSIQDILKYNGSSWENVAEGLHGSNTVIGDMLVYKNELYVCGLIYESEGNAGDGILKFDGTQWTDVGGSFNSGAILSKLLVYEDELYAFGIFTSVGNGLPTNNIAKWNGERWCTFNYGFNNRIGTAEIHNDKLVIGGGFTMIGEDSIGVLAMAKESLIPYFCDTTTVSSNSISKIDNFTFEIFPNPAQESITIKLDLEKKDNISIELFNSIGQLVYNRNIGSFRGERIEHLNLKKLPSGIFYVKINTSISSETQKIIKSN